MRMVSEAASEYSSQWKTSKMIARDIDLSPRTVEMYRAQLMKKFSAATSSELVRKLAWGSSGSVAG